MVEVKEAITNLEKEICCRNEKDIVCDQFVTCETCPHFVADEDLIESMKAVLEELNALTDKYTKEIEEVL